MVTRWQTVWIIGASSGIGKALALELAPFCKKLVASARSEEKLKQVCANADNISYRLLDVTNADRAKEIAQEIDVDEAPLDLVVISSGYWSNTEGLEWDLETFKRSVDVNFIGAVGIVDAVKDRMSVRGSGHIGIISSVAGYRGLPNAGSYGPTKAALINFAESIQPQMSKIGITVSLINPGFVKTPLTDTNSFPMPFIMSPEDAAVRIRKGLEKKYFEVSFPKRLVIPMKLMRLLPNRIYLWLTSQLVGNK